jgi:hypothetical protein
VSTFSELKEQAEKDVRARLQSTSSESMHHFVMDSTNYFVDHGAGLLAALRVGQSPGERPMPIFERSSIQQMEQRWRTLLRCWPTVMILMSFTPACSLKRLHSRHHPSCTRHSTSHGRAFNRPQVA